MQQIQLLFSIILITLLLASFFAFVVWTLSRMQQQKKQVWEQVNLLAEVTMQEKEKARITNQLHEDFAQTLSTIKIFLYHFQLTRPEDLTLQNQIADYLDDVIMKIRGIAREYLPYFLQNNNLDQALYTYAEHINKHHNDLITLNIEEDELPPINTQQAVNIYRILQEIIDNTIQHAAATELIISISVRQGMLKLTTQDNGRGFDYQQQMDVNKGSGLTNIINRLRLLKGQIKVHSQAGGTLYVMEIPL